MKVIAHPSKTRRNAYVLGGIVLAALCAVPFLTLVFPHLKGCALLLAGAACFVALRVGMDIAPTARSWMQGYVGERQVLADLQALPDEYAAVTNFVVPGTKQGDVDLLLIGPMGVLVVEIKTYPGHIRYTQGKWWRVQSNGWKSALKSVSGQAKRNRQAVAAYIKQAQARVPMQTENINIQPLLIFVGTEKLDAGGLDMTALLVGDARAYVQSLPPRLAPSVVSAIVPLFAAHRSSSK